MAENLIYLVGLIPSIIWLVFYLRKDPHPESFYSIMKVFFLGIIIAWVALYLEKVVKGGIISIGLDNMITIVLSIFIGGALIEELLKYLVVRFSIYGDKEMDEPIDLIMYMIVAALGFATLENVLLIKGIVSSMGNIKAMETMAWRTVSATLLHALSSGIIGWFIIQSFRNIKKRYLIIVSGIIVSTTLHGLYNLSIMEIEGIKKFLIPVILLTIMSVILSFLIKKSKKIKGICK